MPEVDFVLVQPLYEGNVGFAARAIKNFGFSRLVLVDPCPLGDDAIARAGHAKDVLESASRLTLDEVFSGSDLVIATTGEVSKSICNPMRMPYYSPREIRSLVEPHRGKVSLLFGRENWGLNNREIRRSDVICTIPTSPDYPILNLSHAVAILAYELADLPRGEYLLAGRTQMEHLYQHIDQYLTLIDHPDFKRDGTMLMMRRILGRANLTAREASTLHGLMRRSEWYIRPDTRAPDDDIEDGTQDIRED
ncbi:MAG TPA: RNA methyltransferase [Methanolinea sp.]|jgi:TrmH family RNA methyltransferase|nr:MAG: putative RNA methyltransferase [Methanoregulaceae archaeon PtaB.Bin009]OPY40724.1 MAG: putative RNA methyltransferase [Methanoregulaceae archaeon PtaU1.Bin066]HII76245.1 RNA methyltransferase [Methanolinea sp.]HNQ30575.1 RNA methyltransferase [Methanolinea sp.]